MTNAFATLPGIKWTSLLALSILLVSCAGKSPLNLPDPPPLEDQPVIEIADVNLLSMSPAMQEFVELHAYDRGNPGEQGLVAGRRRYGPIPAQFPL